jgi:hypothetical protein
MFIVLPAMLFFGGYLLLFKGFNSAEMWAGRIFACVIIVPIILLWWFLSLFSESGHARGGEGLRYYLIFPIAGAVYHYERVLSFIAIASFYAIFGYMKLKA